MATGLGRIAASDPGAPIVVGIMPGRLNDGEQDFIDSIRLEQMNEAPTPELPTQFRGNNKIHISNGNSPVTLELDHTGGREYYEIHHIIPISKGGDVYNIDNLGITSPKRHIDIHSTRQSK